MNEPKKIIEDIRMNKWGVDLETDSNSKKVIDGIKQTLNRSLEQLSQDLYSKEIHFILELIQNADDNEYEDNIEPALKFRLDSDKILVKNNEKGFTEEDVRALCDVGETTKEKALGYIGEKGIGFKSVFRVSHEPQIYSNGFRFKFKRDDPEEEVGFIIPHWIEEIPKYVDSDRTNIVLPLRDEVTDELIKFKEIDPRLILFLRKLKKITIENVKEGTFKSFSKKDKSGKVVIKHSEGKDFWKLVNKEVRVPDEIEEEKRKNIEKTEITLAFPLKTNGEAETHTEQKVFAFLPTRSYGFNFIIQADFLVPANREDIHKDKKWNEFLRENITSIFLEAVEKFKNDNQLMKTYYNFIPESKDIKGEFFSPVVEQIQKELKSKKCILTQSKNWRKPNNLLRGDDELRDLLQNEELIEILDREFVSNEIDINKSVLDALDMPEFEFADLLQFLENESWLNEKKDVWFSELYTYLGNMELSENEKNKLEDCRILRLENGSLRSISDTEIFFPIAGGNKYGFESELSILKKEILDPEEGSEKEIKNFLKDLGVKDVNALEIVDNHILPIYGMGDEEKKWKNKDDETLLGYVQYIKDNIEEYEEKYKEKKNPLEKIKENLVVRISTEDEKTHYRKPNEIYLPKIYGNENNLEVLFEDVEVDYVDEIYIKNILKEANSKNKEEKLKKWKKFFQKIGVNEVPKIVYYEEKCDEYESHTNCQFQDKLNIPEEDREDVPERYWKGRHGRHKVEDWKPSEEFEKILSDLSMRKGKILFRIIRDYWNQKYSKYDQMKYTWYYRTSNSKKLPSSFIRILKNKLKVPTTEGTLASPDELFLNDSKIKSLLGDTVKYIDGKIENDDLIENLEINTDADPKNVLEYAKKQVKKGCTDKEKFKNLYEFLNNHFDDENTDFSMKKEFRDNHLILVPETEKKYFKLQEVIWEDVSDVFKDNKIYLEKHFEELENFFVNKLDVNRKPLPEDYANTLVTISEKDEISEQDRETIVEIYEELDYNLDPNKVAETIDKKDWWDDFIEKEIFLTNKNEFWANDGNVFIKNDSQLFELFSKNDDIAFLWLPKGYHQDKIKSFINKCDIGYISENCKLTPMIGDTSTDKNEELTDYIQNIIPFVFRYLYWKEHSRYEKLKEKKELEKLPLIEVYIADDLKVKYKVNYKPNPWNSIYKITKKTCVLDGNKLYISQDPESTTFDIPIEISKIFGEIKGLEDFLLLLNEVEDHYKREEIMDARDIKILPSKERKYLFEKDSKTSDEKSKSEFESEISESDMESEVIDSDSDDSPVSAEQQTKRRKGREKPDHPIYDPDDLVLDGQTITIKAEPDEKTRDQVSETDTSSSGSFGDSFEGSQSHLKKIDRLGMWVTRQYELNRVEKNYECKNPEDYVFDIHNEELYSEAKADDIAGPVLNELEEKGLPELYPGFDVLVVNPKSNEADRLIELKSSRTNTRTLEITWNEWKTARDPGFRDLYYLYNVGNLGKDSRSIPYIKEIPNPFQLLNAKTKEKKEVKKTVKININNFKREGEIKKTKLTIADRNN